MPLIKNAQLTFAIRIDSRKSTAAYSSHKRTELISIIRICMIYFSVKEIKHKMGQHIR